MFGLFLKYFLQQRCGHRLGVLAAVGQFDKNETRVATIRALVCFRAPLPTMGVDIP
jgi:hypothetical protein